MFKVRVPIKGSIRENCRDDTRQYKIIQLDIPSGRPVIYDTCLEDDLHYWLEDHNIKYSIFWNDTIGICFPNRWWIVFEKAEDAMLFKLTWG